MMESIRKDTRPNFFLMKYNYDYYVEKLYLLPWFFFTQTIIEKRKPLSEKARRAGWVGCNIMLNKFPPEGLKITERRGFCLGGRGGEGVGGVGDGPGGVEGVEGVLPLPPSPDPPLPPELPSPPNIFGVLVPKNINRKRYQRIRKITIPIATSMILSALIRRNQLKSTIF